LMVFNATFNNISVISWWSVLLVEETWGPRENDRPVASHWQTLSHNVHLALIEIQTHISVIGSDCIESCKSNYHTIRAMTAPTDYDLNMYIMYEYIHFVIRKPKIATYTGKSEIV
jgi:hypothetical protein